MDLTGSVMIACIKCILGFASFRNPERGSRYVQTLVKVFMEDAHDSDIYDMLDQVYSDLDSRLVCPRPTPRLVKTGLETSRYQDSNLENSKSGFIYYLSQENKFRNLSTDNRSYRLDLRFDILIYFS